VAATGKDDRRESAVSTVADKVRHGVTRVHGDDQRPEKESRQAEDRQPAARCFVYPSGARDGTGKIDSNLSMLTRLADLNPNDQRLLRRSLYDICS